MWLPLLLGATLLLPAQDPVRVEASLSDARATVGGSVILAISVETKGDAPGEIPVPVLPQGLDLGSISDYSQVQLTFPGGRRRITRREIVVFAREPGAYRIPSIALTIDGRRYQTAQLALVVTGAARGGRASVTAESDVASDPVRLRAWLRPDEVYVGEQVLYTAEAVFPEELRVRQGRAPVFEPPEASGFWVYDLPDAVTTSLRVVNGGAAEVQSFRQVLFPLTAGTFRIPPSRMQYELRQGFLFTPETRTARADAVTLRVRPLPRGAPAGFDGVVGTYRISAGFTKPRVTEGEPAVLRLVVQGSGNLKGVTRPPLESVADADVYAAGEQVELGFPGGRVSGRKVLEWNVVPAASGVLTVPPIHYAWFDPGAGRYRSYVSDTLRIEVVPAGSELLEGQGLAPLRERPTPSRLGWTGSPGFAALQLLPPLLLLGWVIVRRRRTRPRVQPVDAGLLRAEALLPQQPRASLDELAQWLRARPADARCTALLERVRQLRYSPVPPSAEQCRGLLREARQFTAETGAKARAHIAPLVLLLVLAAGGSDAEWFALGVERYHSSRFEDAAGAFRTYLQAQPADASAWYDLGNALARNGEPGGATWAWLRALELNPRLRDARANLRLAGASGALQELAPTVPLSSSEARVVAALAWWLTWLAAWLRLRRRSRAGTGLLAGAGVVLVLAASLLAARALAPHRAVILQATSLRDAPALHAGTVVELRPGAPLTILEERSGWRLVRSRDLREGWVEAGSIGALQPLAR